MQLIKPRKFIVLIHRYIGIMVGLILVVIGLTGSLLVFNPEIQQATLTQKFGSILSQQHQASVAEVMATANGAIANRPDFKISDLIPPKDTTSPWQARARNDTTSGALQIFINPYTAALMGAFDEKANLMQSVLRLHYRLLAGDAGVKVAGIAGLLMFILGITGLILWPGWKKLTLGFRIKWKAHPQRINFDLHKVAGVIAVTFLVFTGFTGFAWNFHEFTEPIIYAATFSSKPKEPVSTSTPDKDILALDLVLQKADAALPGTIATWISIPTKSEEVFHIYRKFPQNNSDYSSSVYLDRYSGEILKVVNARDGSLGDRVLGSFTPLHYGTFWGLPSRILYLFVGLAPLTLLITGLNMYRYRKWGKAVKQEAIAHSQRITTDV